MAFKFHTNFHRRPITYGYELPPSDREEFDYLSDDDLMSREFVHYRGQWHDLGDVMCAPDSMSALEWHGFNSDSYWSGIAFRFPRLMADATPDDDEFVICAYVVAEDD